MGVLNCQQRSEIILIERPYRADMAQRRWSMKITRLGQPLTLFDASLRGNGRRTQFCQRPLFLKTC